MSKDFKDLHPINLDFDFEHGIPAVHYPMTYPNWPESLYKISNWPAPGCDAELEFTGWRDEGIAKHDTISISNYLSPAPPVLVIKGPEAINFFEDHLVNSFKKFPINSAKHILILKYERKVICEKFSV